MLDGFLGMPEKCIHEGFRSWGLEDGEQNALLSPTPLRQESLPYLTYTTKFSDKGSFEENIPSKAMRFENHCSWKLVSKWRPSECTQETAFQHSSRVMEGTNGTQSNRLLEKNDMKGLLM